MDTKSKNNHKLRGRIKALFEKMKSSRSFAWMVLILLVFWAAWDMVSVYPQYGYPVEEEERVEESNLQETEKNIAYYLTEGNYFLTLQQKELIEDNTKDTAAEGTEPETVLSYEELMKQFSEHEFFLLKKYLSYEMADKEDVVIYSTLDEEDTGSLMKENTEYALQFIFTYDEQGDLQNVQVLGDAADKKLQFEMEQVCYSTADECKSNFPGAVGVTPENITIAYGMTEKSLQEYHTMIMTGEYDEFGIIMEGGLLGTNDAGEKVVVDARGIYRRMYNWGVWIVLLAVLMPFNKAWNIGDNKIFRKPLEAVLAVWFVILVFVPIFEMSLLLPALKMSATANQNGFTYLLGTSYRYEVFLNLFWWLGIFAAACWSAVSLRAVFTMKGEYVRQRIWCVKFYQKRKAEKEAYELAVQEGKAPENPGGLQRLGRKLQSVWGKCKAYLRRAYDGLLHIDFQNQADRTILRVVILNGIVLLVICCFWFYGVFALIIYSLLLFVFLRKYFRDISKKYQLLLKSTNELAEGNLDAEIEGDFGIYNPVKDELKKIQTGFQKAVQKEVKSERMKTELISNVSHDLKTPLTAIITYVDLLKNETDEEKRKEYLDVLERKSQRLKILIEDLFEISKAASKNVTLNLMSVDLVNLLKQVEFENQDKIKEANLEVRWSLPDEKTVLLLDNQKTYRIFENLMVNITKYALPHTRVYVTVESLATEVRVMMKNVSAAELNFNTDEITDRFVRGDSSRNTEGSGLGLAIAKSFTELQKGTMKIETEADLFKVEITFPK